MPAVKSLITALENPDRYIREEAANVLGKIGDSLAVPALISSLKDEDEFVREEAAKALGRIGDKRAVPYLKGIVENESCDSDLCDIVKSALVKLNK